MWIAHAHHLDTQPKCLEPASTEQFTKRGDELGPRRGADFGTDPGDMVLYGLGRYVKLRADLPVRAPVQHEPGHLDLPLGQPGKLPVRPGWIGQVRRGEVAGPLQ